jgi:uncharacterized protein YjbI with pentapeptide repeats
MTSDLKNRHTSQIKIYHAIIDEEVDEFNKICLSEDYFDLSSHSFLSVDFRKLDLSKASFNFDNCYFKSSDLRGQTLVKSTFSGASMHLARVSGVLFPETVSAQEIELSINKGTRIRLSSNHV